MKTLRQRMISLASEMLNIACELELECHNGGHEKLTRFVTVHGEKMALEDALKLSGVTEKAYNWRVNTGGWDADEAATVPPRGRRTLK